MEKQLELLVLGLGGGGKTLLIEHLKRAARHALISVPCLHRVWRCV
jgi:hypothetical protein